MIKTGTLVLLHSEQTLNWQSPSKKVPEPDSEALLTALMDGVFSQGERRF